jgi:hypothetical protein
MTARPIWESYELWKSAQTAVGLVRVVPIRAKLLLDSESGDR